MWIVMSIRPEYFNRIFKGVKQTEIRSRAPLQYIHAILWYLPYPIMRIKGLSIPARNTEYDSYELREEGEKEVKEEKIKEVWEIIKTQNIGLTRQEFYDYASIREKIHLIPLGRSWGLQEINPAILEGWCIPRNFTYAPPSWIKVLYEAGVFEQCKEDSLVKEALSGSSVRD